MSGNFSIAFNLLDAPRAMLWESWLKIREEDSDEYRTKVKALRPMRAWSTPELMDLYDITSRDSEWVPYGPYAVDEIVLDSGDGVHLYQ